jgi:hypothetical protein
MSQNKVMTLYNLCILPVYFELQLIQFAAIRVQLLTPYLTDVQHLIVACLYRYTV